MWVHTFKWIVEKEADKKNALGLEENGEKIDEEIDKKEAEIATKSVNKSQSKEETN